MTYRSSFAKRQALLALMATIAASSLVACTEDDGGNTADAGTDLDVIEDTDTSPDTCVPADCEGECIEGECVVDTCVPADCEGECIEGECVVDACVPADCEGECIEGECVVDTCIPADCEGECIEGECVVDTCVPADCEGECIEGECVADAEITCVLGDDVATLQAAFDDVRCDELYVPNGSWTTQNVTATRSLRIVGESREGAVLDAEGAGRVFASLSAGVEIELAALTLSGGRAANGGAVYSNAGGDLYLDDVVFEGNVATSLGGAIYMDGGRLEGSSCVFDGNRVEVTAELSGLEVPGGGALALRGVGLDFTDCDFSGNEVTVSLDASVTSGFSGGAGGAIHARDGSLYFERTDFVENEIVWDGAGGKTRRGGAIFASGVDITIRDADLSLNGMPRPTACTDCPNGGGGAIYAVDGSLDIADANFGLNQVVGVVDESIQRGGALYLDGTVLNVVRTVFTGNEVIDGVNRLGGAIFLLFFEAGRTLNAQLTDVEFSYNEVVCADAACPSNARAVGGAVALQITRGELQVLMNRVLGRANNSESGSAHGYGGFLHVAALQAAASLELDVINSTFTGNTANGDSNLLYMSTNGNQTDGYASIVARIISSTIADNGSGTVLHLAPSSQSPPEQLDLRFRNTIFDEADEDACVIPSSHVMVSEGGFVHHDISDCRLTSDSSDLITTDPGLLPLQNDGGFTFTMPLSPASVVRNAGEAGGCTVDGEPLTVDQRSETRTTANCTPGAWSP